MSEFYTGKRLSVKGQLCTVRYVGPVGGKPGQWLGVEWDDTSRGKHSGTFEGVEYFTCRSSSGTAGSFLRSTVSLDPTCSIIEALRSKYASSESDALPDQKSTSSKDTLNNSASVWISGKQVEEIGYRKISKQQAQLEKLRIVILDQMTVSSSSLENQDGSSLAQVSPNVCQLDLGRNLFETLEDIAAACGSLEHLRSLTLDGNRLYDLLGTLQASQDLLFRTITTLGLNSMLLGWEELDSILQHFPNLQALSISGNSLTGQNSCRFPSALESITIEDNQLRDLDALESLSHCCPNLQTLVLKNNKISQLQSGLISKDQISMATMPLAFSFSSSVTDVDLSFNIVSSWSFVNSLPSVFPGLRNLRLSNNPIYEVAAPVQRDILSPTDTSAIISARIPGLQTLNYYRIGPKERLNAETFYLSRIAAEVSRSPKEEEAAIIARHPRYAELCEEYGEPHFERKSDPRTDPNSLAARLVKCQFHARKGPSSLLMAINSRKQTLVIPKSFSIYSVLGLVGRHFNLPPARFKLIWETGERDPVMEPISKQGVQEWDSDEEESEDHGMKWMDREVELSPGTRPLGTVIESSEAVIRIELKEGSTSTNFTP